jgi:hypothetical protein
LEGGGGGVWGRFGAVVGRPAGRPPTTRPAPPIPTPLQPGDVLSACSAITLKAGKEGRYEREGYGDRPYDNWVGGAAVHNPPAARRAPPLRPFAAARSRAPEAAPTLGQQHQRPQGEGGGGLWGSFGGPWAARGSGGGAGKRRARRLNPVLGFRGALVKGPPPPEPRSKHFPHTAGQCQWPPPGDGAHRLRGPGVQNGDGRAQVEQREVGGLWTEPRGRPTLLTAGAACRLGAQGGGSPPAAGLSWIQPPLSKS